jgi:amino acid adenylation domain-containing protein
MEDWLVAALIRDLGQIIGSFTSGSLPVASLCRIDDADVAAVLAAALGPAVEFENEPSLAAAFARQAARTPDRVALIDGTTRHTYRDLDRAANRLARHFAATYGVGRGSIIGVMLPKSDHAVLAILAALRTGAAYLPLDPAMPANYVVRQLAAVRPKLLVLEGATLERLENHDSSVFAIDLELEDVVQSDAAFDGGAASTDPAYVICTSGSTGQPRAVCVEHGAVFNYISWKIAYFDYGVGDTTLQFAPLSFDSSVSDLFTMLLSGGSLVLMPPDDRLSASKVARAIHEHGVTTFAVVPSIYRAVIGRLAARPPTLRIVTIAGERVSRELVTEHHRRFPGVRLVNEYGPTECTVCATACDLENDSSDGHPLIGRAIANVEVLVLGPDLRLLPPGGVGEICVGGRQLARGYLGDPELTADRFVMHPFRPGERLYRTGDFARLLPGGQLDFLGRLDGQLKIRGNRVESGEIERLLEAEPGVQQAVVVTRPAQSGDLELIAYVVGGADPALLQARVAAHLPPYMVPAHVIALAEPPLTRNGKIDRQALPAPGGRTAIPDQRALSPIEAAVARLWAEILGPNDFAPEDDFFRVGGNSLQAVRLTAALHRAFGVELSLRHIFNSPHLHAIAALVAERTPRRAPIVRLPDAPTYEASHAQKRLWLIHEQHAPLSTAYNIGEVLAGRGRFDPQAMQAALADVAARHETLRTGLLWQAGALRQFVLPAPLKPPFEIVDLNAESDPATVLRQRIRWGESFDLARPPLWRAIGALLPQSRWVLVLVLHHSIGDGRSIEVLARDINCAYLARREGSVPDFTPLPIQYRDATACHAAEIAGLRGQAARRFWLDRHRDRSPSVPLPADRSRPVPLSRGPVGHRTAPLPEAEPLLRLARDLGATPSMAVVALVIALIHRQTHEPEVAVGIPVLSRLHPELIDNQVGCYLNTLALRQLVNGDEGFAVLLGKVRTEMVDALDHDLWPFDLLVEELGIRNDYGSQPLFDVMVSYERIDRLDAEPKEGLVRCPPEELGLAGLFMPGVSKFDMAIAFRHDATGLSVEVEYDTALYDTDRIDRLIRQLGVLAAAADQNRPISLMPLLPREEHHAVLHRFVRTSETQGDGETVVDRFDATARRWPHRRALQAADLDLSYHELDRLSARIAGAVRDNFRPAPAPLVAVALDRSGWYVAATLGVLRAGSAYLPIDPSWPPGRIAAVLGGSGCRLALTVGSSWSPPDGIAIDTIDLQNLPPARAAAVQRPRPSDLAYVIYTSGTTGKPKGVMIEHASLANLIDWHINAFAVTEDSRASLYASVGFDAAVWELWPYISAGATVVPTSTEVDRTPRGFAQFLKRHHISHAFAPTAIAEALGALPQPALPDGLVLLVGGDVLRRGVATGVHAFNNYGPTEATVVATSHPMRADEDHPPNIIGRPILNMQALLLDPAKELVGIGVDGELYLGGVGLARGYLHDAAETETRFVANPYGPGRLYRTGDLARWRGDGTLEFRGRIDDQVKLRGQRVELAELEAALRQQPGVEEAAVVVAPLAGDPALIAAVVAQTGDLTVETLKEGLRHVLPEVMIPSRILFTERLPMLPSGKLDRGAIAALAATGTGNGGVPSGILSEVCAIFAHVLGLPTVGPDDDFFALGGHSLRAMELMARLGDALSVEIDRRMLFIAPTPRAVTDAVRQAAPEGTTPALAATAEASSPAVIPLTPAQRRIWDLDRLFPQSPLFTVIAAWRLAGALDVAALHSAVRELGRRHELLRSRLVLLDGEPAWLPEAEGPALAVGALDDDHAAAAQAFIALAARDGFNLSGDPPFRAQLLHLGETDHLLVLSLHHIACDQWSIDVIERDLSALYLAETAGVTADLPLAPLSFCAVATWYRTMLDEGWIERNRARWLRSIGPISGPLRLLRTSSEIPSLMLAQRVSTVPTGTGLAVRLRVAARRERMTPFMAALAAALVVTARRNAGVARVATNVALRDRRDLRDVVGLLVNTVIVGVDLTTADSISDAAQLVRRAALEAYSCAECPVEEMMRTPLPSAGGNVSGLCPLMLLFDDDESAKRSLLGLPGTRFADHDAVASALTPHEAILTVRLTGERMEAALLSCSEQVPQEAATGFLNEYLEVVSAYVREPDQAWRCASLR